MLAVGLLSFYQKKIITVHHLGVGGVTSTTWRFVVYLRWIDVMPTSSIMTGQVLQQTLQTALSDVVGASGECNFEYREEVQPPKAIGTVTSSGSWDSSPLFSGDTLGPYLHVLPFMEVHFWVRVECAYSKTPVVRRVKTTELFAIWDYEGKLESQQWSYIQQLDKTLMADLSRQASHPMIVTSANTAYCYNRVNHVIMSLVWLVLTNGNIPAIVAALICLQTMFFFSGRVLANQRCFLEARFISPT